MDSRLGWAVEIGSHVAAFQSVAINRPADVVGSTVRVVAFNAQSGARVDDIVAALRRPPLAGAGIVLLTETDWRTRRSSRREIAAELAAALQMSFVYCPEFGFLQVTGSPTAFIGNAILSAAPLADARIVPMPSFRLRWKRVNLIGEPRAITATAVFGGRAITIGVAHLNSRCHPDGRAQQMAAFLGAIASDKPAIIGGDWNTTTMALERPRAMGLVAARMALQPRRFRYPERYEPLFGHLERAGFEVQGANAPGVPTFTFSRAIPSMMRPKLDWIAVRGLIPVAGTARVLPALIQAQRRRLSDHDFVTCEIILEN